jgi:cytochrome o ubiquinol oxidase subunit 2
VNLASWHRWGAKQRIIAAPALALLTSGCDRGILNPVGPVGSAEKTILINSTAIMLAIIIPTILATIAVAWWFRAGNKKARYRPDWEYSGAVEMVVWSIPALTVLLLGGIAWIGSHDLDPAKPLAARGDPLNVEVVSLDWKWLFIYPEQRIATVNQLVVPVGTPVNFRLTSATVMNSFFVPQLGSQIYAMGGMTTHLNLMADAPGEFQGISANFSGDGFADMQFKVNAVQAGDFDGWIQKVRGQGPALDDPGYAALTKPSHAVPPTTYRSVDPALFERIVENTAAMPEKARAAGAWCPPVQQAGG